MNAFDNLLVDNKFLQLANFQDLTTFNIRQLSTFNFDNLVSNMQLGPIILSFRTYNLSKLRSWKLSALNFEYVHFRTSKFEDSTLRFLNFGDFHFRTLRFQLWSFRHLTSKVIFGSFRFLSLSRRRPSHRVPGQATDISPLTDPPSKDDSQSQLSFRLGFVRLPSVSQSAVTTSIDTRVRYTVTWPCVNIR